MSAWAYRMVGAILIGTLLLYMLGYLRIDAD